MLHFLKTVNVGPIQEMEMEFAPRINVITGDNGLGKSFLLDIAWWALTRRWPAEVNRRARTGLAARPRGGGEAQISSTIAYRGGSPIEYASTFDRSKDAWTRPRGRPGNPGLVVYAQADGGFSVWDPILNYYEETPERAYERRPAYVFAPSEVWDGLYDPSEDRGGVCLSNGLLADWALWQKENGESFHLLRRLLEALSPSKDEPLAPGELSKLSLGDARWMPTLRTSYGLDVPLPMASAAVRRVLAIAYLLAWGGQEHLRAAKYRDETPTRRITLLVDEIESHLHPRWQRTIVRSLLAAIDGLVEGAETQLILATHSPLLMASLEPLFDDERDAWFDLDFDPKDRRVVLERRPFIRHGESSRWLESEAFDLDTGGRSEEAERLLEEAGLALLDPSFDRARAIAMEDRLRRLLGELDPFWTAWRHVGARKGWLPPRNGNGTDA